MTLIRYQADFETVDLSPWREVQPAIAGDVMNRTGAMAARIKPLSPGMKLCAQARTARCMTGDNLPLHVLLTLVRPGEVIVADAGGFTDRAVFGGLMTQGAIHAGAAGIVIDGAVRDAAEIREAGFPCFVAGINPAGPHKGFGGEIDGTISCAGAIVRPGDIVLGDDDGVVVVPLEDASEVLAASRAKIADEARALERLAAGESLAAQFGMTAPDPVRK